MATPQRAARKVSPESAFFWKDDRSAQVTRMLAYFDDEQPSRVFMAVALEKAADQPIGQEIFQVVVTEAAGVRANGSLVHTRYDPCGEWQTRNMLRRLEFTDRVIDEMLTRARMAFDGLEQLSTGAS